MSLSRVTISAAVLLTAPAAAFASATFTPLGFLQGGTTSYANGISADGLIVAGASSGSAAGGQFRAIRRAADGTLLSLDALPQATSAAAYGASANGAVLVGTCDTRVGFVQKNRAVRWTSAGAIQDLGLVSSDGGFPGAAPTESSAARCSADGSVVVGSHYFPSFGYRACRWSGGAWQDLGALAPGPFSSTANDVSPDGSIVVGWADDTAPANGPFAYRWTSSGMQSLGTLPGGHTSSAVAISANGNVIVGYSGASSSNNTLAFRWTAALGMQPLGTIPGLNGYIAGAVNADGSAIVGTAYDSTGSPRAFLWTQPLGMVDLNTYLPTLGLDLSGWTLGSPGGISVDGLTMVGYGYHNGAIEGWVATIPAPGTAALLAVAPMTVARRKRF